jgi:hypothetical protein
VSNSRSLLFVNIVHRLDASVTSQDALRFQWSEARRLGLPTTTLLTYPALFDSVCCDLVSEMCGPDDELGLHFHELKGARLAEHYRVKEPVFWLWPRAKRLQLVEEIIARFTEVFGRTPRSIGGYILDAWTLEQIKLRHPGVSTAITSCFEEGVKMYYGNNRNWLLFSDGGPWNPYFPSKANALIPADGPGERLDIVAIPHLNRDMIMALSSRDDWFASHPGNVFRARINEGAECGYLFRFYKEWERQAEINGWSYMNLFVSSPWLLGRHWAIESEKDVRQLYTTSLEYLKEREEAGKVRNLTMDAFGEIYRKELPSAAPTVCHWRDVLRESRREVVWTANAHHRCAFDFARGGTLVDFRPYDGRLDGNLGTECLSLWNGNYPFLVSSEHCGGHWNTSFTAEISDGTHTCSLADRRARVRVEKSDAGEWVIFSGPVCYELGGKKLVLESVWEGNQSSEITVRRKVISWDGAWEELELAEVFLGRAGTTEYPEDQRGTTLHAPDCELPYTYSGEEVVLEEPQWLAARIPRLGLELQLIAKTPSARGMLRDGVVFSPSWQLRMSYALQPNKEIITCLQTNPWKNP